MYLSLLSLPMKNPEESWLNQFSSKNLGKVITLTISPASFSNQTFDYASELTNGFEAKSAGSKMLIASKNNQNR